MYGAGSPGYFTLFWKFSFLPPVSTQRIKAPFEWKRKKIYGSYSGAGMDETLKQVE